MSEGTIVAEINHVVRGEKSVFYASDRARSYWPEDPRTVEINDMRPIANQLSFDRNGFVLVNQPTAVTDFRDSAQIDQTYLPEIVELVQRLTGAEKVLTFGVIVRTDAANTGDGAKPSWGAHVDYGDRTVRETTHDLLGDEEAAKWLQRRYMLINLRRPIRLVERTPLALCDASTVKADDLFESEVRGGLGDPNRRSLWGFNLAWAPGQRWYYAPLMQPDEIFAFKLFDSDPSRVQFTAHSAFVDPTSREDAPPRLSIELRTISFMPPDA